MPSRSAQPRILVISPLPPATGGIATWTQLVLGSSLAQEYDLQVVDTQSIRLPGPIARIERLATSGVALHRLVRRLRRMQPDLVHVNTSAQLPGLARDFLYLQMARSTGATTVLHVHSSRLPAVLHAPRLGTTVRRRLDHTDRVLVLSESDQRHLRAEGLFHVSHVPNFTPIRPLPTRVPCPDGTTRFLFVGSLLDSKGIPELLRAIRGLANAKLTLLGPAKPGEEQRIHQTIAQAQLAGRVRWIGTVPSEEVWAHYGAADVLVLPSHTEGAPMSLLEAMMAGLPTVVTAVGAVPEMVVPDRTALMIPPRNGLALRTALQTLIANPSLRRAMGASARMHAEQHFSIDRGIDRLSQVYQALLSGGDRR